MSERYVMIVRGKPVPYPEPDGATYLPAGAGFVYDTRVGRVVDRYKEGREPLNLPSFAGRGFPSTY